MKSILLNENAIQSFFQTLDAQTLLDIHLFESIDSTNRFLKALPPPSTPNTRSICLAETQTAGRGRFGRHWYSPYGENIYCSMRWSFEHQAIDLSGLSLVISLAIIDRLHALNITDEVRIKWPNDLLWNHQKLGGVLIELSQDKHSSMDLIIGIGLNVNAKLPPSPDPEKPWCSLYDITQKQLDRNVLVAHLIHQVSVYIQQFVIHGFEQFMSAWQNVDDLYHQPVGVSQQTQTIRGYAQGVNARGELLLLDEAGTTHTLSSGETSLLLRRDTR
jgi:BirA family biotin operon repressor/biotin-[acetyl-CoA-carboxylase] ligase